MDDRPTEVDSPKDELGKPQLIARLKKWGAVLGTIGALSSAIGSVWSAFTAIDDLHDTILANKEAIALMQRENAEEHARMRDQMQRLLGAVREANAQHGEVITNLRIAVAALQAAQNVREGRSGYLPAEPPPPGEDAPVASASVGLPTTEAPRSTRARINLSRRAREDSVQALQRAREAQMARSPLSGLTL